MPIAIAIAIRIQTRRGVYPYAASQTLLVIRRSGCVGEFQA